MLVLRKALNSCLIIRGRVLRMGKRALITGVTGQDGAYLTKLLLEKGYRVFGTYRRLSTPNFWRLQALDVFGKLEMIPVDMTDMSSLIESIQIAEPDEIYNLAAQSFVGTSFEQPIITASVSGVSVASFLEAIRQIRPGTKFYQASTSEMYGNVAETPQTEKTPFRPMSPYAAAKLYAYWVTKNYREGYNIFSSNGILFNHESPLRGMEFVTRKITNAVAKISLGIEDSISLGNIEAERDWGYSMDYVEAMWKMLQHDKPDDFVVATNEKHSVKEFLELSFRTAGLEWERHVKIDNRFKRPLDVVALQGDYSKARDELDWEPKVGFEKLVEMMTREDMKRWERWQKGEKFPWDAPTYPSEAKIITRTLRV